MLLQNSTDSSCSFGVLRFKMTPYAMVRTFPNKIFFIISIAELVIRNSSYGSWYRLKGRVKPQSPIQLTYVDLTILKIQRNNSVCSDKCFEMSLIPQKTSNLIFLWQNRLSDSVEKNRSKIMEGKNRQKGKPCRKEEAKRRNGSKQNESK